MKKELKPIGTQKDKISNDFLKPYFAGAKNVFGLAPHKNVSK